MIIIPGIYPESFEEVADKLYALSGITKFVQIIISDGSYDMRRSWDPSGILPESFDYEFDLALVPWKEYLTKAYSMSAKSAVVHVDTFTDQDFLDLIAIVSSYKKSLGVVVSNDTDVKIIIEAVRKLETSQVFADPEKLFIQVTGVKNETGNIRLFDERVLSRIRVLKKLFPTHPIQVSGRVTPDTAGQVRQAGADRLVSSSYIFGHEDIREAIDNLKHSAAEAVVDIPKPELDEKKTLVLPKIVQTFFDKTEALVFTKQAKAVRPQGKKYNASTDEIVYEIEEDVFSKE